MRIALLTLLSFFYLSADAQCTNDIEYADFIKIQKKEYEGRHYLHKTIEVPVEDDHCLSAWLDGNTLMMDYLVTNFVDSKAYEGLKELSDQEKIHNTFIGAVKNDAQFIELTEELVAKAIDQTSPKDTVTINQLLDVAVKYFSILKINENGHYVGKVCVGLNDIKSTLKERKPFIEAFCFSSILQNYKSSKYNLYTEFVNALRELYTVNLGIDENERLMRAQGAMFMLMHNNDTLRSMLLQEYENKADKLPFILTDNIKA